VDVATGPVRLLLAVFVGATRLIDNMLLEPDASGGGGFLGRRARKRPAKKLVRVGGSCSFPFMGP
jgi:hypothetical protein